MTMSVCVIDDDELIRGRALEMLGGDGLDVFAAESARAALDQLAQHDVDAVLVDIVMPDMDGLELIAEMRRQWPVLRIVAVSGGGRVGAKLYLDLARQMGANACISKPFTREQLLEALTPN